MVYFLRYDMYTMKALGGDSRSSDIGVGTGGAEGAIAPSIFQLLFFSLPHNSDRVQMV